MLGIILLDFCGDNPLNSAGNDPLNLAGEIYCLYSAGDKLPESTGDNDSIPLGKLFQTVLGKYLLHWGILYSSGEHSYTPLRNIKTVGDTLILAGEYSYTPLGNIKTF